MRSQQVASALHSHFKGSSEHLEFIAPDEFRSLIASRVVSPAICGNSKVGKFAAFRIKFDTRDSFSGNHAFVE
jgi:hypothetical protein